ncbi:hypothetical protein [Sphingopyxis chilensis]
MRRMQQPASILELPSRLICAPSDRRHLPSRLQAPDIGAGLGPGELVLDRKRDPNLVGKTEAFLVALGHQLSLHKEA